MANNDFTLTSTEESRSGANACLDALRAIEENYEKTLHREDGMSMEEWWRIHDDAVAEMLQRNIADQHRDWVAGFVAVFGEYAMYINGSGIPNLQKWKPEACMTTKEKAACREKFAKEVEEIAS